MGGVQVEWGDEFSVNGVMGKDFCPNLLQPFLEHIVTTEGGSVLMFFISFSFGGCSLIGLTSWGAFLGRV